jgi:hypothetical protein
MRISSSSLEAAPNTVAWFCRPTQAAGGIEVGILPIGLSAHNSNMQGTVSVSQAAQPPASLVQGQHQPTATGELPGLTDMCLLRLLTSTNAMLGVVLLPVYGHAYTKDVLLVQYSGSQGIYGVEAQTAWRRVRMRSDRGW